MSWALQNACWEHFTPLHGSVQATDGGLPTNDGRQEQVKLPRVLTQTAFAPQMPGVDLHSSTSRHCVPAAVKPGLQTHWPLEHLALLVQSKLDLHRVLTSVASQATLPLPVKPGGHSQVKPGLVFLHTALAPHGFTWAEHSSVSLQPVKGSPVSPGLQVH